MKLKRTALFVGMLAALLPSFSVAQSLTGPGRELSWALHYDPKTLDPAKVDDQASEMVRYLTAGVLVRLNRRTLAAEPMLAERWEISPDGKTVTLHLRQNLRFSDGSPLTSADAVASLHRVLSPSTAAPVADEFVDPAKVLVDAPDPLTVRLRLPARIVSLLAILDEIAIEPANRITESKVTAGPFFVADYRHGESLHLQRNLYFWRKDEKGAALPYLPSLRLEIVSNRESEELRFVRGQYGVLDSVPPETFGALSHRLSGAVRDLGPSLNTEQMWFNQVQRAPLPDYEKRWFADLAFRTAVSQAIHRADLARIAYDGHATPANGFISPANTSWYNRQLPPVHEDAAEALRLLAAHGYRKQGNQLFDQDGHPVRFSLLTNTGNRARERMAALIQQDLGAQGMQVNVVPLDVPALIDRLMHTFNYEAALLGLSNVQPDPSSMMNLWLSSSPNHQWNPSEPTPATPWEAEIDKNMRFQAENGDVRARKAAVDRVQGLVSEHLPFIYLVYPNTLCAMSPDLEGVHPSVLQPDVVSSIETIAWKGAQR